MTEELFDRYETKEVELKEVIELKKKKEDELEEAKAQNDLLQIPDEDVMMTETKLGSGAYGGKRIKHY